MDRHSLLENSFLLLSLLLLLELRCLQQKQQSLHPLLLCLLSRIVSEEKQIFYGFLEYFRYWKSDAEFCVRFALTLMGDCWGLSDNDLLTHIYGSFVKFYSRAFVGGIAWRSSCIQLHLFTLCRVSWNFPVPTSENNTYNYEYKYETRNNNNRSTSKVTSIIH